ncbi:DxFTY motif-containing membrane protein [Spiroplasma endosymbiont of Crioceris asparagi]|uniref:DxFTY motif-containing membrane protein n=1 Tax=Spiroplasma endosymbiont of Crioceris asparagi TaxID=3066286 RepID=UPI0030D16980
MRTWITRICFETKESIDEKTDFFLMTFWILISSLIPGIIIWLTIGYDFNLTTLTHKNITRALVTIGYIFWVYLSCILFYIFALIKSEMFMFNTGFVLIIITVIFSKPLVDNMLSNSSHKETIELIIRFIVAIFMGIVGIICGAVFHWFLLNREFKIKEWYENKYNLLLNNSSEISQKDKKRIEKINLKIQKINTEQELKLLKNEQKLKLVDEKLNKHLDKVSKINQKLDEKEKKAKEKEKDIKF